VVRRDSHARARDRGRIGRDRRRRHVLAKRYAGDRVSDPQLSIDGEPVEPLPDEIEGVFDGDDQEVAADGGIDP